MNVTDVVSVSHLLANLDDISLHVKIDQIGNIHAILVRRDLAVQLIWINMWTQSIWRWKGWNATSATKNSLHLVYSSGTSVSSTLILMRSHLHATTATADSNKNAYLISTCLSILQRSTSASSAVNSSTRIPSCRIIFSLIQATTSTTALSASIQHVAQLT